jgi:hypothetical protein
MSRTEIVVEGILKPDGTLELDQKPNLIPGRVTVILRQETKADASLPESWWSAMQNARKKMEDAGCHALDEDEMQARIDSLREEDRVDELLREMNEQPRKPEQP